MRGRDYMNKSIFIVLIALFLFLVPVASATTSVTDDYVSTTGWLDGSLGWGNLTDFLGNCSSNYVIRGFDSNTIYCTQLGNWSADKTSYYTKTQIDSLIPKNGSDAYFTSIQSDDWDNVTITTSQVSDYTESDLNVNYSDSSNSSDYWDNLDSPSDINTADITDDNTYAKVSGDNFTGDVGVGNTALHVGTTNNDALIYFLSDSNWEEEYFGWGDLIESFTFSDDIFVSGYVSSTGAMTAQGDITSSGDIVTTGAGDDLWLGDSTQGDANVSLNASGHAKFTETIQAKWFNGSWNGSDTLNDSMKDYTDGKFIDQSEESNLDVNSSEYWDGLNDPSDINAGDITDDGTYVTSESDPEWTGNQSNYMNNDTLYAIFFSDINNFTGSVTDTKYCTYDSGAGIINCTSDGGSDGYNTSSEILAVVEANNYWNNSYLIEYTNLTLCGDTEILKISGGAWTCAADATGSGSGGTSLWTTSGSWMHPNLTAGGYNNINVTKINATDWTNVTITESQISDLSHSVNGTGIYVLYVLSDDWSNVSITESQVSDADWWDADGDVDANEISESKIDFDTSCGAGNHLYVDGDDLGCESDDDTTYTNGSGISLVGTQFNHSDTSSQSSSENSDITFIQDIVLDTYGHITSIVAASLPTATPSNGDTTHVSTADQIYDWVTGLGYATTTYVDSLGNWSADKDDYYTSAEVDSDFYSISNPYGYYNSTNPQTETDPEWSANYTLYNDTWTSTDSEIWAVVDNSTFVKNGTMTDTKLCTWDASNGIINCTTETSGWTYSDYFDQDLNTTDAVTFTTVDTGQGANELYDMNQNVLTTSDVVFAQVNSSDWTNVSLTDLIFDLNSVSKTEFGYLNGVTSAIQTQFSNILDGTTAFTDFNGNDIIDSDNYNADSIDNEHINWADIDNLGNEGALAANTVDSDQYVDGSIDAIHLAADIIDETKIADNGIDSEHYNDGSIDAVHLAADVIDETKIADNGIDSEHYNDDSIDNAHINWADLTYLGDNGQPTSDAIENVVPQEKCFTLEDPADADDNVPVWSPSVAITITDIYCRTQGGTSAQITLSDGTNDLDTVTCDSDGQADDGSIANSGFTANERMEFDTGTVSGSVDWVNYCFTYTVD